MMSSQWTRAREIVVRHRKRLLHSSLGRTLGCPKDDAFEGQALQIAPQGTHPARVSKGHDLHKRVALLPPNAASVASLSAPQFRLRCLPCDARVLPPIRRDSASTARVVTHRPLRSRAATGPPMPVASLAQAFRNFSTATPLASAAYQTQFQHQAESSDDHYSMSQTTSHLAHDAFHQHVSDDSTSSPVVPEDQVPASSSSASASQALPSPFSAASTRKRKPVQTTALRRLSVKADRIKTGRKKGSSAFDILVHLESPIYKEDLRPTRLSAAGELLENLVELSPDVQQSGTESLKLQLARHLSEAALYVARRSLETKHASLAQEAGQAMSDLLPIESEDVEIIALRGQAAALKGSLADAFKAIDDVLSSPSAGTMKKILDRAGQGWQKSPLGPKIQQLAGLLHAVIEQFTDEVITADVRQSRGSVSQDEEIPEGSSPKELKETPRTKRRDHLLRNRLSKLSTFASGARDERAEAQRYAAQDLLFRLLTYTPILGLFSFRFRDTQRAFDDLVASLTRTESMDLSKHILTQKTVSEHARSASIATLGLSLLRARKVDTVAAIVMKAHRAKCQLSEVLMRELIRLNSSTGYHSRSHEILTVFNQQVEKDQTLGRADAEQRRKTLLYVGSFLARSGRIDELIQFWKQLVTEYPNLSASRPLRCQFLTAYARAYDPQDSPQYQEVFEKHLKEHWLEAGSEAKHAQKMTWDSSIYLTVVSAYLNFGKVEEAHRIAALMAQSKIHGLRVAYTLIIAHHASRIDTEGAVAAWDSMIQKGIRPDRHAYAVMIGLFARRGDNTTAFALLKDFESMGGVPTAAMLIPLMRRLAKVGDHDQAFKMFQAMLDHPKIAVTRDAYNCIMAILVSRGATFASVLRVFENMEREGHQPNAASYACVIQSACESGLEDYAESLFEQADQIVVDDSDLGGYLRPLARPRAHPILFSILIHYFLRRGNPSSAKEYFDELQARGHKVGKPTWSVLINQYVRSGETTNLKLARDIIMNQVGELSSAEDIAAAELEDSEEAGALPKFTRKSFSQTDLRRVRVAEALYAPLLSSVADQGLTGRVAAILKELSAKGIDLSSSTLNIAMEAYRKTDDLESMWTLWNRLFSQLTRQKVTKVTTPLSSPSGGDVPGPAPVDSVSRNIRAPRVSRNALCIPLSMMLETLDARADFRSMSDLWAKVRDAGFAFDPGNWNQLAFMLIKIGRLEDALRVVENVLNQMGPVFKYGAPGLGNTSLQRRNAKVEDETRGINRLPSRLRSKLGPGIDTRFSRGPNDNLFRKEQPRELRDQEEWERQNRPDLYSRMGFRYRNPNVVEQYGRADDDVAEVDGALPDDRFPLDQALREGRAQEVKQHLWRPRNYVLFALTDLCKDYNKRQRSRTGITMTPLRDLLDRYPRADAILRQWESILEHYEAHEGATAGKMGKQGSTRRGPSKRRGTSS